MAGHGTANVETSSAWGGKVSPFNVSYGKLMMWFFLVSDALTFGGLLISYGVFRHTTTEAWPIGEETFDSLPFLGHGFPLAYVALMTLILIVSSVTMKLVRKQPVCCILKLSEKTSVFLPILLTL